MGRLATGRATRLDREEAFRFHHRRETAVSFQNYMTTYNPLGLCKFITKGSFTPAQTAELVNKALGWNWTGQDVLETGAQLFNFKRLINNRLGITAKDDVLPFRLTTEPRPTGSAAGVLPDMELMLKDYYRLRKWDENGVPTKRRCCRKRNAVSL